MKVLILNTYSTLNRGDAAIVLSQIHLLKKYFPDAEITITSKTPALDRSFYSTKGIRVLPPLTPALSVYRGAKNKFMRGALSMLDLEAKKRFVETLRKSELVLSCGGGYFFSYRKALPGTTFWQNVIHVHMAALMEKPVIFMPQSLGPFASFLAGRGIKHVLEGKNVLKIFVREEASRNIVKGIVRKELHPRISLCPDMAFYLRNGILHPGFSESFSVNQTGPTLAVNLREWGFPEADGRAAKRLKRKEYLETFIHVAEAFIRHYRGNVVVFPQTMGPDPGEDDRGICMEFCRMFRKRFRGAGSLVYVEPPACSLEGYVDFLSRNTLLLGTRLHACVLALLSGVPTVSIGYQHKSSGTMDMLGLDRFNFNIVDLKPEMLFASIEEIMEQRLDVQREISYGLERARARIEQNVGSLFKSFSQR